VLLVGVKPQKKKGRRITMIIRRFNPEEYIKKIPTELTQELIAWLDQESSWFKTYSEWPEYITRLELMFSLIKRELAERSVLELIEWEDSEHVDSKPESGDDDSGYDDGYNDGNWFDTGGDPGNWWKP
jgi:hypothetical protein